MIIETGGMSVRIEADRIARTADGGGVIQCPPGRTVKVEPLSGVECWARNRAGNDASYMTHGHPIQTLAAGEHLYLAHLSPAPQGGQWERPSYWGEPARSIIDTMLPIVCVPWALPRSLSSATPVAPFFRPPCPGTGAMAQHLRSAPILKDRCKVDRLPRRIDWRAIPGAPTGAQLLRLFRDFHGELFDGWSTDTHTPGLQNPGYGTAWASAVSQALCYLCSTEPVEAKRQLAEAMVQWGLDLAAAFGDGRKNFASGGHMAGRLALIILAGHLIDGADALLTVRATAPMFGATFMEDAAFQPSPERWRHSTPIDWENPQTWTTSQRQNQRNYMGQVVGAQIGTALAMRLLGRTAEMGPTHFETCRWWMTDSASSSIAAAFARNGVAQDWGKDYAMGFGSGTCAAAWRQVFA